MEQDFTERIELLARIPRSKQDYLRTIRHWRMLKIASQGDYIWLKGFTLRDLEAVTLRSIPFLDFYELKNNLLYKIGEQLPELKQSHLLWTPIERGIPIEKPLPNPNYFGIQDQLKIQLVPSTEEQIPFALYCSREDLGHYLKNNSRIRWQNLSWSIQATEFALVLGTPLLPIPGQTYWRLGDHLLPSGYQLEYPSVAGAIQQAFNPAGDWMLWQADQSYSLIEKRAFVKLKLSSFRLSSRNH